MACNDAPLTPNSSYHRQQPGMPVTVVRKRMCLLSVWWCPCVFVVTHPRHRGITPPRLRGASPVMLHHECYSPSPSTRFTASVSHSHSLFLPPHRQHFWMYPPIPTPPQNDVWSTRPDWLRKLYSLTFFHDCDDTVLGSRGPDARPAPQATRSMWASRVWRFPPTTPTLPSPHQVTCPPLHSLSEEEGQPYRAQLSFVMNNWAWLTFLCICILSVIFRIRTFLIHSVLAVMLLHATPCS